MADDAPRYRLSVTSAVLRCAAGLNDVPLVVDAAGEGVRARGFVNEWVMPRDNRLTVRLEWPTPLPYAPGTASHVSAVDLDAGAPGPPPLVRFDWPPRGVREGYPYRAALPFAVPADPPTRVWSEAETIAEVGPGRRREIAVAARALHAALGNREVAAAADLMAYRQRELALAYGEDPQAAQAEHRQVVGDLVGSPGFALLPLRDEELSVSIVGGGKLVLATRDGADLIQTVDMPGFRYRLPVYFALVAGRWVVAR